MIVEVKASISIMNATIYGSDWFKSADFDLVAR